MSASALLFLNICTESNFGLWGKKGGTVFLRKVLFVMFCLIKAAQMTGSPKCFNK